MSDTPHASLDSPALLHREGATVRVRERVLQKAPRVYHERYRRTELRLGRQRGARVAQVDLARRLAEAIWHMLTRNQPFAPAGATNPLAA